MDLNNIKLPKMVTNPPLPNSVYERMREQEWHEDKIEKEEKQISLLTEQIELLKEQNKELKDANAQSKSELKKSKCLNNFMAIIAFLTFVATVVFGLVTLLMK